MENEGWSGDNIAFGMGGKLLQGLDRDTQKCAFKASSVVVDAIPREVWKDPVTDPGKKSKKGRLALVKGLGGEIRTVERVSGAMPEDMLKTVFWDGELREDWTWEEVRDRAAEPFKAATNA
jgi:nicotinamide phosphoribosyltransferase